MWCVLTAIIVLQAHIGSTYKAAWNRFLGVLIGSLTGGICAVFLGSDPFTLGMGIFFTVILCALFYVQESYRIACASAAVIIILWGLTPEVSPWTFSLYRFLDSCLGIMIAMAVAHAIWPKEAMDKLRVQLATLFNQLDLLFESVVNFSTTSRPAESESGFYELSTLIQESRDLLEQAKPDLFTKTAKIEKWILILDNCQHIVECYISLDAVFKQNTLQILDAPLLSCVEDKIELIHKSFLHFSKIFFQQQTKSSLSLEEGLDQLKSELARFRSTHSTRGYSLEDVESFFVFCYTLKDLLETLIRIEKDVKDLQAAEQL